MPTPDPAATSQALEPRPDLLAWLDANSGARDIGAAPVLKLPVTLTFDADRLGIVGAALGPADGQALALDDSALGISLMDRVRTKCPADQPTCRVWLNGRWRGVTDGKGAVQVVKFAGVIGAGDAGDRVELVPE
ncbi:MAG: hypothetical protein R3B06_01310 [Kofleriaceae bacterium]